MVSKRVMQAVLALSVTLMGCQPPTPEEVAKKTATDTSNLLREAWRTAEETNDWSSVNDTLEGFGMPRSTAEQPRFPAVSNFDTTSDRLKAVMEAVFTESNVVAREGGSVTFQVRGLDFCKDPNGSQSESCVEQIDRLQVTLKVSGDLDVGVQFGPSRIEAAVLRVRGGKSITLELDYGKFAEVSAFIQTALNPEATQTATFSGSGRFELKVEKNAERDFSFSVGALSELRGDFSGTDGVKRVYATQAKAPLLRVRIEAPAKKVTATVDVGETTFTGLLDDVGVFGRSGRPGEVFLAGVSAELVVDQNGSKLNRVGLGQKASTIRSAADLLVSLDVNKDLGRTFDLTWAAESQGLRFVASPGVSVSALFNLKPVTTPNWTPSEQTRHVQYTASFTAPSNTPTLLAYTKRSNVPNDVAFKLLEGTLDLRADVLSPCSGVDNVAACNEFKAQSMCGGRAPPVDCSTYGSNSCANSSYFSCLESAYFCSGNTFSSSASQQASECTLANSNPIAPRSFSAPSCVGVGSVSGGSIVEGFRSSSCP